jgi:hypothetical protein
MQQVADSMWYDSYSLLLLLLMRTSRGGSRLERMQGALPLLLLAGSMCDIMVCTGWRYTKAQGVSGKACS